MNKDTLLSNPFKVLSYLCKEVDDTNNVVINKSKISDKTGLTRPTVMTCIEKLRNDGFLQMKSVESTTAKISQEVIDLVFRMDPYSTNFKEKLYDFIYDAAHTFCEKEKDNNTIIGYTLYSIQKIEEDSLLIKDNRINEEEIYRAVEVYLYLKYHGKSETLSQFVRNTLFANYKDINIGIKDNVANNPDYIFLDKIFGYDNVSDNDNFEHMDILRSAVLKKFEGELEPNYLFQISSWLQIRFVSICVLIDIFLKEKLSYMQDVRANWFSENSFIVTEDVDDVVSEIEYLISENFLITTDENINIHIIEKESYPYIINDDIICARKAKQNFIQNMRSGCLIDEDELRMVIEDSKEPIKNPLLIEFLRGNEPQPIIPQYEIMERPKINKNNIYVISKENFRQFKNVAKQLIEIPKAEGYVFDGHLLAEGEEDHDIFEYLMMPDDSWSETLNIVSVSDKSTLTKPQIVKVKGFKKVKLTHYLNTVFKSKLT